MPSFLIASILSVNTQRFVLTTASVWYFHDILAVAMCSTFVPAKNPRGCCFHYSKNVFHRSRHQLLRHSPMVSCHQDVRTCPSTKKQMNLYALVWPLISHVTLSRIPSGPYQLMGYAHIIPEDALVTGITIPARPDINHKPL